MYKISNDVVDAMRTKKCTKAEISFMLHIAQYQDVFGKIYSVHYKDICNEIGISIQTFYDIIRSLSFKGIILCDKINPADFVITIKNNDFSDASFKRGYIDVAKFEFKSEKFKSLKAGAQMLFLYTQRFVEGKHMLLNNFYETFSQIFGVTRKTIQLYCQSLKEAGLLYISKKRNRAYNYEITFKASKELHRKELTRPHESDGFIENIKSVIYNNFSHYIDKNEDSHILYNIANLTNSQRGKIVDFPLLILKAVKDSFRIQKEEHKEKLKLNVALVNKCLTKLVQFG